MSSPPFVKQQHLFVYSCRTAFSTLQLSLQCNLQWFKGSFGRLVFLHSLAVFPVIVARVIHQDPDLTDVQPEEEELVSVFQFEHYFMDLWRLVCPQFNAFAFDSES